MCGGEDDDGTREMVPIQNPSNCLTSSPFLGLSVETFSFSHHTLIQMNSSLLVVFKSRAKTLGGRCCLDATADDERSRTSRSHTSPTSTATRRTRSMLNVGIFSSFLDSIVGIADGV